MKIIDKAIKPYEIHINNNSYNVEEFTGNTDKKGNEITKNHGYFTSIQSAVEKIVKLKVNSNDDIVSLNEFLGRYKSLKESISQTLSL